MPVRNAITRLEELGLIRTSAYQGAWVAEMDLQDYFTFMLLRIEAEALAASFAAQKSTDSLIEMLEDVCDRMEAARDANDYEGFGRLNRKSHSLVCEASGNPTLIEHINTLVKRTQIAVSLFGIMSSENSCKEHRDWIEALRNHDSQRSSTPILRYQRCRANLELMRAILDGHPNVQNNHFLQHAAASEQGRRYVTEFIPFFEEIKERNRYEDL